MQCCNSFVIGDNVNFLHTSKVTSKMDMPTEEEEEEEEEEQQEQEERRRKNS